MTDTDGANKLYESNTKLCAAVKKHKCLHDQNSHRKTAPPECEEAWQMVAKELSESIEFCKGRWRSLRRCFFDGLKRKGNKYYLHDHLKFLLEPENKNSKRNSMSTYSNESSPNSLQKYNDNDTKLKDRAAGPLKAYDEDDSKSYCSRTTSADESNENVPQTAGVFIINEFEDDETYLPDNDVEDERRLSFNRSCKRALDPRLIDELDDDESQQKRPRKSEKSNIKTYTVRADKTKIITQKVDSVKNKVTNNITSTKPKLGVDIGVQCGLSCTDFDEIFMQSIKNQLQQMNGRQKMNFKRKIYQSLLEVFDDANDFPNSNETLSSSNKQLPNVVNTTVGELRLMRELVSLVQAAKSTPEIMNAKEKLKASTPVPSKPPLKMPAPIAENHAKSSRSPFSISPTPDQDEDLQFFIDDSDADEEIPLPRSWDEIKAKTTETPKATTQENNIGLPRRILQKVVRVSSSNGGTIVARDGDKKRIYRIVPKQIHTSGNNATPNRNETSVSRILMSKTPQDPRKDNSVGTFYVPSAKGAQDIQKANISAPNFTMRVSNSKPLGSPQSAVVSASFTSNTNHNTTSGQSIFKDVHPANRILSSSTGYFKMLPSSKPCVPPPANQKPSSQLTPTTAAINPSLSKMMATKFSASPMLPPTSTITTKQIQTMRPPPPLLQRRYSICGPPPADKQNTTTLVSAMKTVAPTNIGKSQAQTSISQIQISQPVSLNSKAVNSPTFPATQVTSSSNNPKNLNSPNISMSAQAPTSQDAKIIDKPIEKSKESVVSQRPVTLAKDSELEASILQREIPILETAGTVEADDLDPLFVKAPQIKSEPIDDD